MWRTGVLVLAVILTSIALVQYWNGETSATLATPPVQGPSDAARATPELIGDPPLDFTSWEAYAEWSETVPIFPVSSDEQPLLPDRPDATCEELQDAAGVPKAERTEPAGDRFCPGIVYQVAEPRPVPEH